MTWVRDRDRAETGINTAEDMADMGRSWARKTNPAVQEAIRVAIQRLSKDGTRGVTKKHILKVLFLARERMPDDSDVKLDLAYYWYRDGPYSEVVDANLDHMVTDGLVKVHKTNKSQTYRLIPRLGMRPVVCGDDIDAAKHEIGLTASANSNANDAVKRTYERAPSKWYTAYNREFKSQFESYCKDVLAGRDGTYTDSDMLGRLDDAVLDYPTIPEFMEHRMVFMDFAKMVNVFLRRDPHHIPKDTAKWLPDLCSTIWDTFTYGVRVHHHDPQYDSHVEKWIGMYGEALDKLERETVERMEQFGDVSVNEPRLAPEIEDMILHPENHDFTPLSLDGVRDR